jgi:hypothetical protein
VEAPSALLQILATICTRLGHFGVCAAASGFRTYHQGCRPDHRIPAERLSSGKTTAAGSRIQQANWIVRKARYLHFRFPQAIGRSPAADLDRRDWMRVSIFLWGPCGGNSARDVRCSGTDGVVSPIRLPVCPRRVHGRCGQRPQGRDVGDIAA